MTHEMLESEVERLRESLVLYPGNNGTYYTVPLFHRIQDLQPDQLCRVFQVTQEEDTGLSSAFYAILTQNHAAVYKTPPGLQPETERSEVWLCLERLLLHHPAG